MSIWRMIWQEIAHRKLNFVLGLFSVVVAIATLAGVLTLLDADKLKADEARAQLAATGKDLDKTSAELKEAGAKLEDEMRKIMLGLGFNILILSQDEDLHAMNLTGVPQKTFHEENVDRLVNSDLLIINHVLPVVTKRIPWKEQNGLEILLTGTRGEVPQLHRKMKKPMQEQVPAGTMIVGHQIADHLKLTKGQSVKLMGRDFKVTKIQEPQGDVPDSTVWINLEEAQDMLGMQNEVSAIMALECNCASADRAGKSAMRSPRCCQGRRSSNAAARPSRGPPPAIRPKPPPRKTRKPQRRTKKPPRKTSKRRSGNCSSTKTSPRC